MQITDSNRSFSPSFAQLNTKSKSPILRKPSSMGTLDRATVMQKSKSETTVKHRSPSALKRVSSMPQSRAASAQDNYIKEVWRPPGFCEIPDILGHAFLKASPVTTETTFTFRSSDKSKQISKRPWYPPGSHTDIPELKPIIRVKHEFEGKIHKALPKVSVAHADPKTKYASFREIGTGVNGSVLSASSRSKANVQFALKRCKLDPDREYRAAIIRELRIMSSANPNLIRLREVTVWKNDVWIAMDLMRCSVFAVLVQRGIPEEYAVNITCETLKALSYLHEKGYVHRDVKCENLLLGWNGEVKLTDFGLSTRASRANRDRLGTAKWMAPEVIREDYYNEAIDMWSLGITIIEMMDRVPPHYLIKDEDELFSVVLRSPPPTFTYSYPSMYMRGLVSWLLDEDPATRPPAKDVLAEIDSHIQNNLLQCSTSNELCRFLNQVLPK